MLVARRELFRNRVPDVPGGGTVAYVNDADHAYLADPEHREEGGTPAIIEAVRAGLVFQLKDAVGVETIRAAEERFLGGRCGSGRPSRRSRCSATPTHRGSRSSRSWCARPSGRYLHHNFVVALLNDLFGVQSRGGCSCAGPYGHRLLGIDLEHSREFEREITGGCEGIKPGWVRVNFNYFLSDTVADYVIEAVRLVARDGWRLLGDYRFDVSSGRWTHREGVVEPPLRLHDVKYDGQGDACSDVTPVRRRGPARRAPARRRGPAGRGGRAGPDSPDVDLRRLRAPALVRPARRRARRLSSSGSAVEQGEHGEYAPVQVRVGFQSELAEHLRAARLDCALGDPESSGDTRV